MKNVSFLINMVLILFFTVLSACAEEAFFSIANTHGSNVCISENSVPDPGKDGCWTYANSLYRLIWGVGFDEDFSGISRTGWNYLRELSMYSRGISAENTEKFISAAPLGSVIRVSNCHPGCKHWNNDGLACHHRGHSMLLVDKSASGFTVLQRTDTRCTTEYTWQSFCDKWKNYEYFKYVKWPGAKSAVMPEYELQEQTLAFSTDCEARYDPFMESHVIMKYADGDEIKVTGYVIKSENNIWYRLKDGGYVHSSMVKLLEIGA